MMRNSGNKMLWQKIFERVIKAEKARKEENLLDNSKANSNTVELNEIKLQKI